VTTVLSSSNPSNDLSGLNDDPGAPSAGRALRRDGPSGWMRIFCGEGHTRYESIRRSLQKAAQRRWRSWRTLRPSCWLSSCSASFAPASPTGVARRRASLILLTGMLRLSDDFKPEVLAAVILVAISASLCLCVADRRAVSPKRQSCVSEARAACQNRRRHRVSSGDGLGAVVSPNESSMALAGPQFLRKVLCSPLQSAAGFASHARGHWFESSSAHHLTQTATMVSVARQPPHVFRLAVWGRSCFRPGDITHPDRARRILRRRHDQPPST
jgi:hypothetical protein